MSRQLVGHAPSHFSVSHPIRHVLVLTVTAFVLHFVWENAQCRILFVHGTYDATLWGMAVASAGDVALTWLLYGIVALAAQQWRWTRTPWTWTQWLVLLTTAVVVGVAIEWHALATGRWAYVEAMPRIPGLGVGLVPVVQLALLPPVSFALAERLSPDPAHASDETEIIRSRYDRVAPLYDAMEWLAERSRFRRWRRDLWQRIDPSDNLLELGIGTGKNIECYPPGLGVTAIDISERMLDRARRRAESLESDVELRVADAQALPFPDATFDTVVATFLFCSVPDPVRGLTEARRVLKPGGRLILLEHVLSERPVLRRLMKWLDPLPVHIWGAHIDRETVSNVRRAGFEDVSDEDLSLDVVKRIEATAPSAENDSDFGPETNAPKEHHS